MYYAIPVMLDASTNAAVFSVLQVLFFILVVMVFGVILIPVIGMIKNWRSERIQTLEAQDIPGGSDAADAKMPSERAE